MQASSSTLQQEFRIFKKSLCPRTNILALGVKDIEASQTSGIAFRYGGEIEPVWSYQSRKYVEDVVWSPMGDVLAMIQQDEISRELVFVSRDYDKDPRLLDTPIPLDLDEDDAIQSMSWELLAPDKPLPESISVHAIGDYGKVDHARAAMNLPYTPVTTSSLPPLPKNAPAFVRKARESKLAALGGPDASSKGLYGSCKMSQRWPIQLTPSTQETPGDKSVDGLVSVNHTLGKQLSLLVIATQKGQLFFNLNGGVQFGTYDLSKDFGPIRVRDVSVSDAGRKTKTQIFCLAESLVTEELSCLSVALDVPADAMHIINMSTEMHSILSPLVDRLINGIQTWQEAYSLTRTWVNRIDDENDDAGRLKHLLLILTTGLASPEAKEYLVSRETERNLDKWVPSLTFALDNLRSILVADFIPSFERIILLIEKLDTWADFANEPDGSVARFWQFRDYFPRDLIKAQLALASHILSLLMDMSHELVDQSSSVFAFRQWYLYLVDHYRHEPPAAPPKPEFHVVPCAYFIQSVIGTGSIRAFIGNSPPVTHEIKKWLSNESNAEKPRSLLACTNVLAMNFVHLFDTLIKGPYNVHPQAKEPIYSGPASDVLALSPPFRTPNDIPNPSEKALSAFNGPSPGEVTIALSASVKSLLNFPESHVLDFAFATCTLFCVLTALHMPSTQATHEVHVFNLATHDVTRFPLKLGPEHRWISLGTSQSSAVVACVLSADGRFIEIQSLERN